MRRESVPLAFVLGLGVLTVAGLGGASQTYYIRTDGGTAVQCTGQADAACAGTGTGQACAWAHPYWAVTSDGQWRITGGDTLMIAPGSYMIGWGAPNTGDWCDAPGAFACTLPAVPSGTRQNPTRILGSEWNTGCRKKPELWGTERLEQVFSLVRASDVIIECLEITDHSSCAYAHCDQTVACQRECPPYGLYADAGILALAG